MSHDDYFAGKAPQTFARRHLLSGGAVLAAAAAVGAALPHGAAAQSGRPSAGGTLARAPARRRLGSLQVSPIGLGCMSMAPGFYNPPPEPRDMVALIRSAVDRGVNFFDTAEVYGPHVSERIVGEALQPVRNQVVIASKFAFQIENGRVTGRNSRPEHIRRAVEGMLQRLRTDRIDLLYLHRVDASVPVEDVAGTVGQLIREGKAREFGMSEVAPDTLRRAHAVQRVAALQSEYSLLERLPEVAVLDVCQELGIGFVPWGPTCRALLADRFNEYSRFAEPDRRASVPFFAPDALGENMAVVRLARQWGERKGVTPVQFALAWLLAQRPFIVPIPGTTKLHHLDEDLGALKVEISPTELREFRARLEQLKVVGARARDLAFKNE
jgi:aryl-alcohol dehydrogenase-like predicted oxidoreductase